MEIKNLGIFPRKTKLKVVIFTTFLMFLGEIIFGYLTKSMALVTDAFHMLSDIFALCVAHYAITLTERKKFGKQHTFGWQRAETIGALINAVFLLSLCLTILLQAIERFIEPVTILQPITVLIVGSIGLAVNIFSLFLFHDHGHSHGHGHAAGSLNMKGAFLHVMGDALGSVGVIISAVVIKWSSWTYKDYLDPAVSMFIAGIISFTTWKLFKRTCNILLHVVPSNISVPDIRKDLLELDFVDNLHELHIWQLSDHQTIASVHVILKQDYKDHQYMRLSNTIKRILHLHQVHNTTVQFEIESGNDVDPDMEFDGVVENDVEDSINDNDPEKQVTTSKCLVSCIDNKCKIVTCCPP